MRIGIFGGTFNPIHNCHLKIARQIRRRMKLDRVVFVPSGHPPHKPESQVQSPQDRFSMVRLAIANNPSFGVSDREVSRFGKSYAIETVSWFKQKYPGSEFFFIVGIDAFLEIGSWRDAKRLVGLCHFVVVSRFGFSFAKLAKLKRPVRIEPSTLRALDLGRIKKAEIPLQGDQNLYLVRLPPCRISSTQVRERLKARQNMKNLLPGAVKSYILKNGLYQGEGESVRFNT